MTKDNKKICIAICDDNIEDCKNIYNFCFNYIKSTKKNCSIKKFYDGDSLLISNQSFDILILDVDMPNKDGFVVVKELIEMGKKTNIIFLTGYEKRVREAFKVNAFRYLLKIYYMEELHEALDSVFIKLATEKEITIIDAENVYNFNLEKDIYYIESLGTGSCVYLNGHHIILNNVNLKKWHEYLTEAFFRCHKTYIINFFVYEGYEKSDGDMKAKLKGGYKVPISIRNHKKVRDAYINFVKNRAIML